MQSGVLQEGGADDRQELVASLVSVTRAGDLAAQGVVGVLLSMVRVWGQRGGQDRQELEGQKKGRQEVVEALARRAVAISSDLTPKGLADVLWSLAKLGVCTPSIVSCRV